MYVRHIKSAKLPIRNLILIQLKCTLTNQNASLYVLLGSLFLCLCIIKIPASTCSIYIIIVCFNCNCKEI